MLMVQSIEGLRLPNITFSNSDLNLSSMELHRGQFNTKYVSVSNTL